MGMPGPLPNFGTIMILGKKYMVRKSLDLQSLCFQKSDGDNVGPSDP